MNNKRPSVLQMVSCLVLTAMERMTLVVFTGGAVMPVVVSCWNSPLLSPNQIVVGNGVSAACSADNGKMQAIIRKKDKTVLPNAFMGFVRQNAAGYIK